VSVCRVSVCQCVSVCVRLAHPHDDTCVTVWISKLKSVYLCAPVHVSVCVGLVFFSLCTSTGVVYALHNHNPCVCFTARHRLRLTVEICTHPTLTLWRSARTCVRFTACCPPLELCLRCHTATLPHCHTATLPHCHTATLPHCHTATLPHCIA
jgi:hypothetical protein